MLYNRDLIAHQMTELGITPDLLAEQANVSSFSVNSALAGNLGTLRKLKQIADALKIRWEFITNVDLPESNFHRAVLTNGDRRA